MKNMQLKLYVLKDNETLKTDNDFILLHELAKKLNEEYTEVQEELEHIICEDKCQSVEKLASETFDLIQICVALLNKINNSNLVKHANVKHNYKLKLRGWNVKKEIIIEVKEVK